MDKYISCVLYQAAETRLLIYEIITVSILKSVYSPAIIGLQTNLYGRR